MPALAKPPAVLPRFIPHDSIGAAAGAGTFSKPEPKDKSEALENTESPDRLAHDARNVLSSLLLYCELLAAPGVLSPQHGRYADELLSVTKTAMQIIERMTKAHGSEPALQPQARPVTSLASLPTVSVTDLAAELRRLQPLLTAIAGPAIHLSTATMPCTGRTRLSVEDLTRVLINLVRNASDAMPSGGRVRITAQYGDGLSFLDGDELNQPRSILLTVTDNGPGISEPLHEQIFHLGFTTRKESAGWPSLRRRGLGLSIVRSLVEAAGGTVRFLPAQTRGARFEISLPLIETKTRRLLREPVPPQNHALAADLA
jgi:signal transduction histidine kinase